MLNLRKQWPFWISGVFVGIAEIMNYIVLEKPIGMAYSILVTGLLVWSIKRGMRLTGFNFRDLMTHANDDLTIKYFQRYHEQHGGKCKTMDREHDVSGFDTTVTEGT